MKRQSLVHEFVDYIPDVLKEGTIYICIQFATAMHKCCRGCGREVVTPLSPTDWKLIFDGDSVSLDPSIGNWNFPCQSHYWIRRNRVVWARKWSRREIEEGRAHDRLSKEEYLVTTGGDLHPHGGDQTKSGESLWEKAKKLLDW